jgi:tripartite motif-containing protein 71
MLLSHGLLPAATAAATDGDGPSPGATAQSAATYEPVGAWSVVASPWLDQPEGVAVDADGYVYIADTGQNRIVKTSPSGEFVRTWGSLGSGTGQLDMPTHLAISANGDIYVADTMNDRIQRFTADGDHVSTLGGRGSAPGEFLGPFGVTVAPDGHIYVADTANDRIQKFTSTGTYITSWGESGWTDGAFQFPRDVAVDASGNVYVTDTYNHRVQKFTASGGFLTAWGDYGSDDGLFMLPKGISVGSDGDVYVTDMNNHRIQRFTTSGAFVAAFGSEGSDPGQLREPHDVVMGPDGSLVVADTGNGRIQRLAANGDPLATIGRPLPPAHEAMLYVDTYARWHNALNRYDALLAWYQYDGAQLTQIDHYPDPVRRFRKDEWIMTRDGWTITYVYAGVKLVGLQLTCPEPDPYYHHPEAIQGIAVGADDQLYLALRELDGRRVGLFTEDGVRTGTWSSDLLGHPHTFWALNDLVADQHGNTYVLDSFGRTEFNHQGAEFSISTRYRVQRFDANGDLATSWDQFVSGSIDSPAALAVAPDGRVYLTVAERDTVWAYDTDGTPLTSWGSHGSGSGQFDGPAGIVVGSDGSVYVVDAGNERVQRFTSTGTFVSAWGTSGTGTGQFTGPQGIAVGGDGQVYVADTGNHRIQEFTSTGAFVTAWGSRGSALGQLDGPTDLVVDHAGDVHVIDAGNHRIQRFHPVEAPPLDTTPPVSTLTLTPTSPDGMAGWYRTLPTVTISATDDQSGVAYVEWSLDGGPWTRTGTVTGITDGTRTVRYRAADTVGNLEAARQTTIKLDRQPPQTSSDARASYTGTATITLTRTDTASGVASTSYRLDGGAVLTYSGPIPVSGLGDHTLSFWSTDTAGNVEAEKQVIFTIFTGLTFPDVSPDNVHAVSIARLAEAGVTTGYPDGTYRPELRVTREQMATFLTRALGLDPVPGARFLDVSPDSVHAGAINAMADAGITGGYPDGTFRPKQEITRAQMATFLAKAAGLDPIPGSRFPDVSPDNVHAPNINAVAEAEIALGRADGTYGPNATVTRAQMASFLIRMMDLIAG